MGHSVNHRLAAAPRAGSKDRADHRGGAYSTTLSSIGLVLADRPCLPRRWSCDLRPERASPDYPDHLSNVPCPLPRWIGAGACVGCFCVPRGLPRQSGGSASTTSLSRPAQASLALRPAGSLDRPRRPLSRGFETTSYPTAPLVSYQINRQLSGWFLPPLVFRAFGAHCLLMAKSRHPAPSGARSAVRS